MNQNNTCPSADRITHVVQFYTQKQDLVFPAHSLIEVHQLLQACRQIEAGEKPICLWWKTRQWILQFIKKLEKHEKNSGNDDSQEYEKIDDPQAVFTPQLLESVLPADGLRAKIQMFASRCRYSFANGVFMGCLLLPKHIYEYCREQRQLKQKIQRLEAEYNAEKKPSKINPIFD